LEYKRPYPAQVSVATSISVAPREECARAGLVLALRDSILFQTKISTDVQFGQHTPALTNRHKHVSICYSILHTGLGILDFGTQNHYQFRPWASFGRVPICDHAALNTSRPGPTAGVAATTTLYMLVDL
jgi:hypothetical protein